MTTLAFDVLQHLRTLAKSHPHLVGTYQGLFPGMNIVQESNILRHATEKQIHQIERKTLLDAKRDGISQSAATAWANLAVQMKRAAVTIDDTFIQGLAPLMPLFSKWSDDIKNWLTTKVHVKEFGHLVEAFAHGLEDMVKFMQTKQFQNDLKQLDAAVLDAAHGILDVAKAFHLKPVKDTVAVVGAVAKGVDNLGKGIAATAFYASHPGALGDKLKKDMKTLPKTGIVAQSDQLAGHLWAHPNHEPKKMQVADEELYKLFREYFAFIKKNYKPMSSVGTKVSLQGHAAAHT
jgi:hypothetical protein